MANRDRDAQATDQSENRDPNRDPYNDQRDAQYGDDARAPAGLAEPADRSAQQEGMTGAQGGPQQSGYGSDDSSAQRGSDDVTIHSANADEDEAARMGSGAAAFSPDHNH